ncbi:hypothetical protein C7Y71_009145 [Pseudoprevotella muciniphila]|uniref:Uncharacterized protein n=1 Tax=Pseudoprevotella muciniphila TaxID=2133944 RepID=A0A5P8E893_9BACT|nr:hypothetical protein [Pseudoprevotella muciniphila]QFQ13162.1 hypothetical protein C7Y71_009145 [Pseudoprevotella muciniphila]
MIQIIAYILIVFFSLLSLFALWALISGWNMPAAKKKREEGLEYWRLKSYGKKVWFNHPFDRSKGLFGRPKR